MSQEKFKTMPMQIYIYIYIFFFWGGGGGLKEVHYGIVQVEKSLLGQA